MEAEYNGMHISDLQQYTSLEITAQQSKNKNHLWDPSRFQIVSTILCGTQISEHHGQALQI